jgi:hypothetical protein
MNIKLHHLNLCSKDVAGMEDFYRSVLDLEPEPSLNSARDTTQGYAAPVAFVTDGQNTSAGSTKRAGHSKPSAQNWPTIAATFRLAICSKPFWLCDCNTPGGWR